MKQITEAKQYLNTLRKIEQDLTEQKELFNYDFLHEFQQIIHNLEHKIEISEQNKRILSIGIIGAVKAGKSSFLNALLFDGEEYLPKAATPMTAALTKISYSPTPKAIIHFYSQEDWVVIEEKSSEYDSRLESEYQTYIENYEKRSSKADSRANGYPAGFKKDVSKKIQPQSKEEFEKQQFKRDIPEVLNSAKELTTMAQNTSIFEKLGKSDTIEGDILNKLDNYVGANGMYTPIVSYVELQMNNPKLEGFEIVDTPGLNDPIVSRSMQTKNFLRDCDVVLLLSPCSQFMDVNTIELMTQSLPNAGINEILVIGSKLDSGILNESSRHFSQAYSTSVNSYRKQFRDNLAKIKNSGISNPALQKLEEHDVLFVSSILFSIYNKKKKHMPLNEEEDNIIRQLHRFSGFDETDSRQMPTLAGISKTQRALNDVLKRKEEIINAKDSETVDNTRRDAAQTLEKIQTDAISACSKLENNTADELESRYNAIQNTLNSSRRKLSAFFDNAAVECEKNSRNIEGIIIASMENYTRFHTDAQSHQEHSSYRTGFLWLKKEHVTWSVTDYFANTSDVILNIQSYLGKCTTVINQEFNYIFNKEQLCSQIKEVVIQTFSQGGNDYDADDILIPLDTILNRIQIPQISLSSDRYIDIINSHFSSGYAQNTEIHKLSQVQMTVISQIKDDLLRQLHSCVKSISALLNQQSATFVDEISDKISTELNRLKSQISERETFIASYKDFVQNLKKYKKDLLN